MNVIDAADVHAAHAAAEVLRSGKVVLYPTDTLYGLGADAFSDTAVDLIYQIKGRDEKKPMHAIVSSLEVAAEYGEVGPLVRLLEKQVPKGKVTFVIKKKSDLHRGICRGIDTFGFRIPDHALCQAMLAAFEKPITATSANIAGEVPERSLTSVLEQLAKSDVLPDLALDAGELPVSAPSTVVDFTGARPIILREGAVAAADVWAAIEQEY